MLQGVLGTAFTLRLGVNLARRGLIKLLPELAKLVQEPSLNELAKLLEPGTITVKMCEAAEDYCRENPPKKS